MTSLSDSEFPKAIKKKQKKRPLPADVAVNAIQYRTPHMAASELPPPPPPPPPPPARSPRPVRYTPYAYDGSEGDAFTNSPYQVPPAAPPQTTGHYDEWHNTAKLDPSQDQRLENFDWSNHSLTVNVPGALPVEMQPQGQAGRQVRPGQRELTWQSLLDPPQVSGTEALRSCVLPALWLGPGNRALIRSRDSSPKAAQTGPSAHMLRE